MKPFTAAPLFWSLGWEASTLPNNRGDCARGGSSERIHIHRPPVRPSLLGFRRVVHRRLLCRMEIDAHTHLL